MIDFKKGQLAKIIADPPRAEASYVGMVGVIVKVSLHSVTVQTVRLADRATEGYGPAVYVPKACVQLFQRREGFAGAKQEVDAMERHFRECERLEAAVIRLGNPGPRRGTHSEPWGLPHARLLIDTWRDDLDD